MKRSITIILCFFGLCTNLFAQNKFPEKLTGKWISAQYKAAIEDSLGEKISLNISPQLLQFNSSGECTLQSSFEDIFSLGMPVSIKNFNGVFELVYSQRKRKFLIETIDKYPDHLFLRLPGFPYNILFYRYR